MKTLLTFFILLFSSSIWANSDQITSDEINTILNQISSCVERIGNGKASYGNEYGVKVRVFINPDRTVDDLYIADTNIPTNNTNYDSLIKIALSVFDHKNCHILKLPLGKYDMWNNITFTIGNGFAPTNTFTPTKTLDEIKKLEQKFKKKVDEQKKLEKKIIDEEIKKQKEQEEKWKKEDEEKKQNELKTGVKLVKAYANYIMLKNLNDTYGSSKELNNAKKHIKFIEDYYKDKVETDIDTLWEKGKARYQEEYARSAEIFASDYSAKGLKAFKVLKRELLDEANDNGFSSSNTDKDF